MFYGSLSHSFVISKNSPDSVLSYQHNTPTDQAVVISDGAEDECGIAVQTRVETEPKISAEKKRASQPNVDWKLNLKFKMMISAGRTECAYVSGDLVPRQ